MLQFHLDHAWTFGGATHRDDDAGVAGPLGGRTPRRDGADRHAGVQPRNRSGQVFANNLNGSAGQHGCGAGGKPCGGNGDPPNKEIILVCRASGAEVQTPRLRLVDGAQAVTYVVGSIHGNGDTIPISRATWAAKSLQL